MFRNYQSEISQIDNRIKDLERDISYRKQTISQLDQNIKGAHWEAKRYIGGTQFASPEDEHRELTFRRDELIRGYENEKRNEESRIRNSEFQINLLNNQKQSLQAAWNKEIEDKKRKEEKDKWDKILTENAEKVKREAAERQAAHEQQLHQRQEEARKEADVKEWIKQYKQYKEKPKKENNGSNVQTIPFELPKHAQQTQYIYKKTKQNIGVSICMDSDGNPPIQISIPKTPKPKRISYVKKQIIQIKRPTKQNS